jgi:hypothetical protein
MDSNVLFCGGCGQCSDHSYATAFNMAINLYMLVCGKDCFHIVLIVCLGFLLLLHLQPTKIVSLYTAVL